MFFSILGDSISTYQGYNPDNFAVFYDENNCRRNGLKEVGETWWYRVIQFYGGSLSVNNSYSGSRVSGKVFPAANTLERLRYFGTGPTADYILIYIGFNDFGYGVKIRESKFRIRKNTEYFEDAYDALIKNIKRLYPSTIIICGTLLKTYIANKQWSFPDYHNGHTHFDKYNEVIRRKCGKNSVLLADLAELNIAYETLDGSHPTLIGHKEIANAWIMAMEQGRMIVNK